MTITINTPWVQMAAQEIREVMVEASKEFHYPLTTKIAEVIVKYYNWEENMKIIEENIG